MDEKCFIEIFIVSCGARSWYKDKIGETVFACIIGHTKNEVFVIQYAYDYELKAGNIIFKKPYSIIDIMIL